MEVYFYGKMRVNTAVWLPNQNRWQIKVQKDGVRKTFTSAKPGRTGQREANHKADLWLDEGISSTRLLVETAYVNWIAEVKMTTSQSNWKPIESRWRTMGTARPRQKAGSEPERADAAGGGEQSLRCWTE